MGTTGYLLEFEDESSDDEVKGYQDLYDEMNIATSGFSFSTDAATRIAIALERIAAALERAYPVGTEEGRGDG